LFLLQSPEDFRAPGGQLCFLNSRHSQFQLRSLCAKIFFKGDEILTQGEPGDSLFMSSWLSLSCQYVSVPTLKDSSKGAPAGYPEQSKRNYET